jgi:hypothetical protein
MCRNWRCGACYLTPARRESVQKVTAAYAAPASVPGETKDCAVRALAVAACVAYETAHAACAANGRANRRGTHPATIEAAARQLVASARRDDSMARHGAYAKYHTVGSFAKANPKGHFVVWSQSHAIAICDGIIHDWESRGTRAALRGVIQLV